MGCYLKGCEIATTTTTTADNSTNASNATNMTNETNTTDASTANTTNVTVVNGSDMCPMYFVGNGCCNDTVLTLIQTGSESLDECEDACDAHENCTAFDHTSVSAAVAAGASIRLRRLTGVSTTEVCQLWQGNITAGTVTVE